MAVEWLQNFSIPRKQKHKPIVFGDLQINETNTNETKGKMIPDEDGPWGRISSQKGKD